MAIKLKDQRIITVQLDQAELSALMVENARTAGYIDADFIPDRIQVQEVDPAKGDYHIVFEQVTE